MQTGGVDVEVAAGVAVEEGTAVGVIGVEVRVAVGVAVDGTAVAVLGAPHIRSPLELKPLTN